MGWDDVGQQPAWQQVESPEARPEGAGMPPSVAVLALCLGIGGFVVAMGPPLTAMLGAGAGVAGLVCGALAMRHYSRGGGMAATGAVFGAIAVVVALAFA